MRVHWLSVHEHSRKTGRVKAGKKPVHDYYKVKLFVAALVLGFLSCKSVVQIGIVALYLANAVFSSEHGVVIIK